MHLKHNYPWYWEQSETLTLFLQRRLTLGLNKYTVEKACFPCIIFLNLWTVLDGYREVVCGIFFSLLLFLIHPPIRPSTHLPRERYTQQAQWQFIESWKDTILCVSFILWKKKNERIRQKGKLISLQICCWILKQTLQYFLSLSWYYFKFLQK